jgi:hypothetical protein
VTCTFDPGHPLVRPLKEAGMSRKIVCSLALGALALLVPAAGSAQTFVDVGVWTSGGGGRVVIGGPPVYSVPVYHAPVYRAPVYYPYYPPPIYRPVYVAPRPVYVQPYYGYDRGRHLGWGKKGRPYGAPYVYAGDYRYYGGPRYGRTYRRR